MKSTLVSFFNSTNIGDILIGEMLENLVSQYSQVEKISYSGTQTIQNRKSLQNKPFSYRVKISVYNFSKAIGFGFILNFYFKNIKKRKLDYYEEKIEYSDILVIGGGNMIFDLDQHSSSAARFNSFVKIGKKYNKKVFAISLGIGPFKTLKQEQEAVNALEVCDYISFRDEASYEIFKKYNKSHENVHVSLDPVFLLPQFIKENSNEKVIALNIINNKLLKESDANYSKVINQYIKLADSIVQNFNVKVVLFSTEIADYPAVQDVHRGIKEKESISVVEVSTEKELLKLYSETLILIGTRMHSMIIAYSQGIPIIGLSWQQKVDSMFEIIEEKESLFKYNEIDKSLYEILSCCKYKLENIEEEQKRNKETLKKIRKKSDINYKILEKLSKEIKC